MKPIDIIVIVSISLIVIGIIVLALWKKSKDEEGGVNCGCGGCSGCASAKICPTKQASQESEKETLEESLPQGNPTQETDSEANE